MRNVHSYRTMVLDQLRIRLTTLVIHSKYRYRRVKLKTVTIMVNLICRRWWITLYLGTLIHQKSKAKNYYQICNKSYLALRATKLEERARYMYAKGSAR